MPVHPIAPASEEGPDHRGGNTPFFPPRTHPHTQRRPSAAQQFVGRARDQPHLQLIRPRRGRTGLIEAALFPPTQASYFIGHAQRAAAGAQNDASTACHAERGQAARWPEEPVQQEQEAGVAGASACGHAGAAGAGAGRPGEAAQHRCPQPGGLPAAQRVHAMR